MKLVSKADYKFFSLRKKSNKVTTDHFIIDKSIMYAGKHIILDLWNPLFNNRIDSIKSIIKKAVKISRATIVHMHMHRFGKEQGISGMVVLAESHISLHTWPERGYIAFDIFMCGDTNPELAANYLIEQLKPEKHNIKLIKRGVIKI